MSPPEPSRLFSATLKLFHAAAFVAIITVVFRDELRRLWPWIWPLSATTYLSSLLMSSPLPSASRAAVRAPAYYFSHGGPDVMYNTKHPVYPVLQRIGREITQKVKPKAVVVFSAHWMDKPNSIAFNKAEKTDLIYDFYGFPDHFYKAQYPSKGSPELASRISSLLSEAGIKNEGVKRGLDHGVWAGFHVAFHPTENPLTVPLVQVSIYESEDPEAHYRLGEAVAALRDDNIVVIGAGMSVHNLRDYRVTMGDPKPLPYSVSFDGALKEAAEAAPEERRERMAGLVGRADARKAHPWMDHLMPVYVVAGAAGVDVGRQLWTLQEGSMAWAQYRFGEVPESGEVVA